VQMKVRIAGVLATTAAAVAMMGASAFASVGPVGNVIGNGNLSIASGNSVYAPISIPVDVCGNAVAILGFARLDARAALPSCSTVPSPPPPTTTASSPSS
jgi:hypothetical protein